MNPAKRKRLLVAAGGVVLVAIVVVAFWPGEREPEYKGKKLSEWLAAAKDSDYDSLEGRQAAAAIREIETNALPLLIKWIHYDPPAWKTELAVRVTKYPGNLGWWLIGRKLQRFTYAMNGFSILGGKAEPAVPRLKEIAETTRSGFKFEIRSTAEFIEDTFRKEQLNPWQ